FVTGIGQSGFLDQFLTALGISTGGSAAAPTLGNAPHVNTSSTTTAAARYAAQHPHTKTAAQVKHDAQIAAQNAKTTNHLLDIDNQSAVAHQVAPPDPTPWQKLGEAVGKVGDFL